MLKSYEAVYDHGQLHWIQHPPLDMTQTMRVMVMLEVPQKQKAQTQESIHALLQRTRGVVGKGKTLAEIDREILTMREEWQREWEQ